MDMANGELDRQKLEIKQGIFKTDAEMLEGFNIDEAVKMFDKYTAGTGDLLKSKLVSLVP